MRIRIKIRALGWEWLEEWGNLSKETVALQLAITFIIGVDLEVFV